MKRRFFGLLTIAFGIGLLGSLHAEEEKDIVDTAITAGQFKYLVAALKTTDLVETWKGKGPFTVFAPTDKAFAKIPPEKLEAILADKELLTKILKAHVVEGKVLAADVLKMDGKKVNGFTIDAKDGVKIGEAKVEKPDIVCGNGVIHVIDTVLMPEKSSPEK
jgi:uncharacterized surface protein with fasciclin (FAS1) repeats